MRQNTYIFPTLPYRQHGKGPNRGRFAIFGTFSKVYSTKVGRHLFKRDRSLCNHDNIRESEHEARNLLF